MSEFYREPGAPETTRICPVCNVEMKKVKVGDVILDECPKCHGIFFDAFELKKMDEIDEYADDPELQRLLSYERVNDERDFQLICPNCGSKMVRRKYNLKSDVYIDECYNCGGIWLDAGELKAIRESYMTPEEAREAINKFIYSTPELRDQLAKHEEKMRKLEGLTKEKSFFGLGSFFKFIRYLRED